MECPLDARGNSHGNAHARTAGSGLTAAWRTEDTHPLVVSQI